MRRIAIVAALGGLLVLGVGTASATSGPVSAAGNSARLLHLSGDDHPDATSTPSPEATLPGAACAVDNGDVNDDNVNDVDERDDCAADQARAAGRDDTGTEAVHQHRRGDDQSGQRGPG